MATASNARITLKVSEDGRMIQSVSVDFTNLKCEGFSAGSISTEEGGNHPILDDKFEIEFIRNWQGQRPVYLSHQG